MEMDDGFQLREYARSAMGHYDRRLNTSIARLVGVNEALILNCLGWLMTKGHHDADERTWVYKSYVEWACDMDELFHAGSIRRMFDRLRETGIVLACPIREKPELARRAHLRTDDNRQWFTVDYERLGKLLLEQDRRDEDIRRRKTSQSARKSALTSFTTEYPNNDGGGRVPSARDPRDENDGGSRALGTGGRARLVQGGGARLVQGSSALGTRPPAPSARDLNNEAQRDFHIETQDTTTTGTQARAGQALTTPGNVAVAVSPAAGRGEKHQSAVDEDTLTKSAEIIEKLTGLDPDDVARMVAEFSTKPEDAERHAKHCIRRLKKKKSDGTPALRPEDFRNALVDRLKHNYPPSSVYKGPQQPDHIAEQLVSAEMRRKGRANALRAAGKEKVEVAIAQAIDANPAWHKQWLAGMRFTYAQLVDGIFPELCDAVISQLKERPK